MKGTGNLLPTEQRKMLAHAQGPFKRTEIWSAAAVTLQLGDEACIRVLIQSDGRIARLPFCQEGRDSRPDTPEAGADRSGKGESF